VMKRRKGFTLIELLVVIAIIGILAAMLFPVFARARESARKIQCLANVKNIATAINMYLVDWDDFFPLQSSGPEMDYWNTEPGRGGGGDRDYCNHARQANPYLREPVILEEYIKNRDVWRCPSAKAMTYASVIVPMGRDGYWLNAWMDNESVWVDSDIMPCYLAWPSGWGGDVTDSFLQNRVAVPISQRGAGEGKVFAAGIYINDNMHWASPNTIEDVSHYITCGDAGIGTLWGARFLAFPDYCYGLSTCGMTDCPEACTADWVNCNWTQDCGLDTEHKLQYFNDVNFRKSLTRHMGGSNVGFADGHAKWYMAEAIMFQNCPWDDSVFEGLPTGCCWYPLPEPCQ